MDKKELRNRVAAGLATNWRQQTEQKWEQSRVEMVLKRFTLTTARYDVQARSQALVGAARLTFAGLDEVFPSLPLCFGAYYSHKPLDLDPAMLLPRLLTKPLASPVLEAFAEFRDSYGAQAGARPLALVINHIGLAGGLVVYENEARRSLRPLAGAAPYGELLVSAARTVIGLTAFSTFLRNMTWAPE